MLPQLGAAPKGDKQYYFFICSIPYSVKNMNKKINYVLLMMIVLDIIDGTLRDISLLNGIKIVLYIICFVLLIQNRKEGKK